MYACFQKIWHLTSPEWFSENTIIFSPLAENSFKVYTGLNISYYVV